LISAVLMGEPFTLISAGTPVMKPMSLPDLELRTPMCQSLRYPGGVSAQFRKSRE
jgi:hypothetical protein